MGSLRNPWLPLIHEGVFQCFLLEACALPVWICSAPGVDFYVWCEGRGRDSWLFPDGWPRGPAVFIEKTIFLHLVGLFPVTLVLFVLTHMPMPQRLHCWHLIT